MISRSRDKGLGTLIIDLQLTRENGRVGDYRARMYAAGRLERCGGDARRLVYEAEPFRMGEVAGHRRLSEPVQNLVAKALKAMGYG